METSSFSVTRVVIVVGVKIVRDRSHCLACSILPGDPEAPFLSSRVKTVKYNFVMISSAPEKNARYREHFGQYALQ